MENLFDFLGNLLFPPKCVFCREFCGSGYVCDNCASTLPHSACPYCKQREGLCGCGFKFNLLLSPFPYEKGYKRGVIQLKNQATPRLLKAFSIEMYRLINQDAFDYIVPVPTTKQKLKERGFNQSELLANEVGKLSGIPVRADFLLRSEGSSVQHSLSSAQRKINANASYFPEIGATLQEGSSILLIDDVCTTGSTLNACAVALNQLGATSVIALCATYNQLRTKQNP